MAEERQVNWGLLSRLRLFCKGSEKLSKGKERDFLRAAFENRGCGL
jgi:hypothetical protein